MMYGLIRWWDRRKQFIVPSLLAVGTAVWIQQTEGTIVYELYQRLVGWFYPDSAQHEQLVDARVLELQERLVELESQNEALRELIHGSPAPETKQIFAPIIGRGADSWWQQVTLGRGSKEGLKEGYIVTAPGGLVGRVTSVTPHTSRVLLASDPTSRIGVVISRSRFVGFMRGQGSNRAVMEFFDKVPDVKVGDVVATSSFSRLFPPGTPVGRVESVNLNASPAPTAIVELSAPMNALEWAIVSPHEPLLEVDPEPAPTEAETEETTLDREL